MQQNTKKLSAKSWTSIIIFGLFGQIAWIVENMYFNVFMYKTVTYSLNATSIMVAASAIFATVATLLAGAWSDKIGKRKMFISIGYIIWGFTVMVFAFISKKNTMTLFPSATESTVVTLTIFFIVAMDCVMTIIGSTANDATFNAWVTDITDSSIRGKTDGILSIMPLVAMLFVFGLFDGMTQEGKWKEFFLILGSITSVIGVLGLFLIKDSNVIVSVTDEQYFKSIIYGFKPSVVKENKSLYIVYIIMAIIGIANMTYTPYLIIYIQYFLKIDDYAILLGIIIILASIASVVIGIIMDKHDRRKFFLPMLAAYFIGAITIGLSRTKVLIALTGFVLMAGNLAIASMLAATTRDLTPADKAGGFQGIRMVFAVLIPMCVGPFIGAFVSKTSGGTYFDAATGLEQPIPTDWIFYGAAVISLFTIIPFIFLRKVKYEDMKLNDKQKLEFAQLSEKELIDDSNKSSENESNKVA